MKCITCNWEAVTKPVWPGVNQLCNACSTRRICYDVARLKTWGRSLTYIPVKIRRTNLFPQTCGTSYFQPQKIILSVENSPVHATHLLSVIIHEYAHQAAYLMGREDGHGPLFQEIERRAYEEVLDSKLEVVVEDSIECGGKGGIQHRYAQQTAFVRLWKEKTNG